MSDVKWHGKLLGELSDIDLADALKENRSYQDPIGRYIRHALECELQRRSIAHQQSFSNFSNLQNQQASNLNTGLFGGIFGL